MIQKNIKAYMLLTAFIPTICYGASSEMDTSNSDRPLNHTRITVRQTHELNYYVSEIDHEERCLCVAAVSLVTLTFGAMGGFAAWYFSSK